MTLHSSCLDNQPIKITTQFSGSEWRHWMAFKFWNFVNFFSHFLISLKFYIVVRRRSNSIPWCTLIHVILSLCTWHIIISNLQHAWSEHRSQRSMWMVSKHVSVQQLLLWDYRVGLYSLSFKEEFQRYFDQEGLYMYFTDLSRTPLCAQSHCKHKLSIRLGSW